MGVPMRNPFYSGGPVSDKAFYGRNAELTLLGKRIVSASGGHLREPYVTLQGGRGYGKSSILQQLRVIHGSPRNVFFVDVTASNKASLRDFFEDIVNQTLTNVRRHLEQRDGLWDALMSGLRGALAHIEGVQFGGIGIKWSTAGLKTSQADQAFAELLPAIWNAIKAKTDFRAFVITFDELDPFRHTQNEKVRTEFAYGWKEVADKWRSSHSDILLIISCLTEVYDKLLETQRSLDRHFEVLQIGPFSREDTQDLIRSMLLLGEPIVEATDRFIDCVSQLSGGIPCYIQDLSRHAFNSDTDGKLDRDDFKVAVEQTLNQRCGSFFSSVRAVQGTKHAIRVLRCLAEFKEKNIRRLDLINAVKHSFQDYVIYDEDLDVAETEYSGDQQVTNALARLRYEELVEFGARGVYRMIDPVCDCLVNRFLNGHSVVQSIKRSK